MTNHHLQLTCPGCGESVALVSTSPLVVHLRSFVDEHRRCGGTESVDLEMRTAFSLSA